MAEFTVKVNPLQHLAYIPKSIYRILGSAPTVVTGRRAVVFYPEDAPIEDVIRSLEIIRSDLEHALHLKNPS
jgi:hypothetical protein